MHFSLYMQLLPYLLLLCWFGCRYNADCSQGHCGVSVFEYFGNLFCFVAKLCECHQSILLVAIFFRVILIRPNVVFM
jgi:hypothetical protein